MAEHAARRWASQRPGARRAGAAEAGLGELTDMDSAVLARFFRVLADPTRLRIIELLAAGERTAGELVESVGAPQPRVSAHLACLRHCRFAAAERRGREMVYRLTIAGVAELLVHAERLAAPEADHLATCTRIGPDWI